MANYASLKAAIKDVVKTNGNNKITGALLQQSLLAIINSLGADYQFAGVARPSTNPGTPDQRIFYIASTVGEYSNFGISLSYGEMAILYYDTVWHKSTINIVALSENGIFNANVYLYGKSTSNTVTLEQAIQAASDAGFRNIARVISYYDGHVQIAVLNSNNFNTEWLNIRKWEIINDRYVDGIISKYGYDGHVDESTKNNFLLFQKKWSGKIIRIITTTENISNLRIIATYEDDTDSYYPISRNDYTITTAKEIKFVSVYVVPNSPADDYSLEIYGGLSLELLALQEKENADILNINTDINNIKQDINNLADIVTEEQETTSPVPLIMHTVSGSNGFWVARNGSWENDNIRRGSEKISVVVGEQYKVTTRIGGSTVIGYLVQYGPNGYIGVAPGFTGGSGDAVDKPYTVPKGVTEIAICSYNKTEPTLKKVTITRTAKSYSKKESDARYATAGSEVMRRYGVKWSISDMEDLGQRCFDSVGLNAIIGIGNTNGYSDFDNIYPWSQIKRCNIKSNVNGAKIVTFEGQDGFTLDGSNGDVFVRIPKFGIEKYIEDGYEYRVISSTGNTHPAFIENGKEIDEIFIGAFEASIINNEMFSRSGVIPANNITPIEALAAATEKGAKYSLYDMRCVDAIWSLMAVEYGCRNSNRILGWGYSDYTQPVKSNLLKVTLAATQTNTVQIGIVDSNYTRIKILNTLRVGANITICDDLQTSIIAQRKITNVVCEAVGDNVVITFDGAPLDVNTNMFVGNAPCDTNYCETLGEFYKLNWHTGYANWKPMSGVDQVVETMNPCRYRWIENPIGNVWHFLPDISFNNLQMYVCNNMKDYEFGKYTIPYRPVANLLPLQDNLGEKRDVNTVANPNFWVTSLLNDIFAKGVAFGKTFDTVHDGSITSQKGFGAYYYLYSGNKIIANGGGFDHLWRSNILTMRAWIVPTTKWYLYGARLMFKNID